MQSFKTENKPPPTTSSPKLKAYVVTLEDLIARSGMPTSYTVADLGRDFVATEDSLRTHFNRSARAQKAARQASADQALEVLAKLGQKAAISSDPSGTSGRPISKLEQQLAAEMSAALEPLERDISKLLELDQELLKYLDDIEFGIEQEARELGLPAPPLPSYRHPRYVPPPAKPKCGAKTRRGGPCERTAMPNGRCRNHGGMSTGPKTEEGRRRSSEGTRRYLATKRAAKTDATDGWLRPNFANTIWTTKPSGARARVMGSVSRTTPSGGRATSLPLEQ